MQSPKSMNLTSLRSSEMTILSSLMSRCAIESECKYESPLKTHLKICFTSYSVSMISFLLSLTKSFNVIGKYSRTKYLLPYSTKLL